MNVWNECSFIESLIGSNRWGGFPDGGQVWMIMMESRCAQSWLRWTQVRAFVVIGEGEGQTDSWHYLPLPEGASRVITVTPGRGGVGALEASRDMETGQVPPPPNYGLWLNNNDQWRSRVLGQPWRSGKLGRPWQIRGLGRPWRIRGLCGPWWVAPLHPPHPKIKLLGRSLPGGALWKRGC